MEKDKRIIYADLLRIFATFAVIVLHMSAAELNKYQITDYNWHIFNIYDSLVRWSVPVFVMLSGIFFLDPNKEINFKNLIKKYISRIFFSIIIWGMVYQFSEIIVKFFLYHEEITIEKILEAFSKLLFGPAWYHLWYLYMLIGLYLLVPIYRTITKNATEKELRYILIIFFIFGLCLPLIKTALLQINTEFNINFEIAELINYSGYFFAGYYFSKYTISKKMKINIYISAICSVVITILGTYYISLKNNMTNAYLYGFLLPTTMFEAFAVFLFFKDTFCSSEFSEKSYKRISVLSKCTFGIYLIHAYIITVLSTLGITSDFINPLFAIPLLSFFIFSISFLIIYLLRKIPISKFIM